MRTPTFLPLFCLLAAGTCLQAAGGYKQAEVTRLHNDVKVIKSNVAPRAALVGDAIDAVTSVATGADSRAELRFPDKSLTRLGANSRFTLRGEKRTIDLDQGVLLLQVPKKMGGAKVRTAAVTAAVTGTTVLFEYLPDGFVKLIVIEGSVDLYFNDRPGQFTTVKAGQMIIMQANANTLPQPVDIDLQRLLQTSKLITGEDFSMPNQKEVTGAVNDQKKELSKGDLVQTNLVIPGLGTVAQLHNDRRLEINSVVAGTPPGSNNPPGNNAGNQGQGSNPNTPNEPSTPQPASPHPLQIPGTTVLDSNSTVHTNPHLDLRPSEGSLVTHQGEHYNGASPIDVFAFGQSRNIAHPEYQTWLSSHGGPWALFRFEDLVVNGSPTFDFGGQNPASAVIFAAQNSIRFMEGAEFALPYHGLTHLAFHTHNGSILWDAGFSMYKGDGDSFAPADTSPDVSLVAAGSSADVSIYGGLSIDNSSYYGDTTGGNLLISAGRDIAIGNGNITTGRGAPSQGVSARTVDAHAGRDIKVTGGLVEAGQKIKLQAVQNIRITDSSSLYALASTADTQGKIEIIAQNGDAIVSDSEIYAYPSGGPNPSTIEISGVNVGLTNALVTADVIKAQALGVNGTLHINGSTLNASQSLSLLAQAGNGTILFSGASELASPNILMRAQKVQIQNTGTVNLSSEGNVNIDATTRHYGVGAPHVDGHGYFYGPGSSSLGPASH